MNALSENKKFLTISELKNMGYSYYKIGKLEDEGLISRVNRSTYENLTYKGDENDFFSVEAFVPNGVICLMSAARYYGLTEFLPDVVDVAIERKKKVSTLPDRCLFRIGFGRFFRKSRRNSQPRHTGIRFRAEVKYQELHRKKQHGKPKNAPQKTAIFKNQITQDLSVPASKIGRTHV